MAEILVNLQGSAAWPRGSPIVIMPDGHRWGKLEGPPKFTVIKFPGVEPDKLKDLLLTEQDHFWRLRGETIEQYIDKRRLSGIKDEDIDKEIETMCAPLTRPRAWRFLVDELPSKFKSLVNAGAVSASRAEDRNAIYRAIRDEHRASLGVDVRYASIG